MFKGLGPYRRSIAELVICGLFVSLISVYALWKMDYLGAATEHQIRMTDSTRTAYVAKNIAEGRGYVTDELPAFLVDFYDRTGRLHRPEWVNADRFPFTAYAVAALYLVTGSTSEFVGILLYNAICFVAFLVLLYWFIRRVWDDRWSAVAAIAFALIHPLTYIYLYLKDADMMLLSTGLFAAFYEYYRRDPSERSRKLFVVLGTLLAWLYLARPNIGAGFILCFVVLTAVRSVRVARAGGLARLVRELVRAEALAGLAILLWCLPFIIHSMREWGTPFFSSNALYQLPLGTRFAMDTDTWWKYSEPGRTFELGVLFEQSRGELFAKFTTSWVSTIKYTLHAWALELFIACAMIVWIARRVRPEADPQPAAERGRLQTIRRLAWTIGFVILLNFAVLPLYGYQHYGYRHYLSFMLPLLWLLAGRALVLVVERCRPAAGALRDHVLAYPGRYLGVAVIALLAWNLNKKPEDTNALFVNATKFIDKHWLLSSLTLAALLGHRWLFRRPAAPRILLALAVFVWLRYQPDRGIKNSNLIWYPDNPAVWDVLRERTGLVTSLAVQGEVNWETRRKNIPAPENPMHVYSLLFDHQLEIEDVYIESAAALRDSVFAHAAPGFENYARLQAYRGRLPGYQIAFHEASMTGYPKYRLRPIAKASTVYRLVDRAAVQRMRQSPDRIELGRVDDVVHTTHGWEGYFTIDGKPVVAATDITVVRHRDATMKAHESSSISFFLDDRVPSSVEIEVFVPRRGKFDWYWNLDLYHYDRPADRPQHSIGTFDAKEPGWQRIRLEVPRGMTRRGLNKLGFRATDFVPITMCPASADQATCAQLRTKTSRATAARDEEAVTVYRDPELAIPTPMRASLFAHRLVFQYSSTP